MKLKADDSSIDKIATSLWVNNVSTLLQWFQRIKDLKLSDSVNIDDNIDILTEAVKRITESTIYAFRRSDELSEELWDTLPEGVVFYERIWGTLKPITSVLDLYDESVDSMFQISPDITEVYTWYFIWEFLWLPSAFSIESPQNEGVHLEIKNEILNDEDITHLEEEFLIKVHVLEILV